MDVAPDNVLLDGTFMSMQEAGGGVCTGSCTHIVAKSCP